MIRLEMAATNPKSRASDWLVLPHDPIQELTENLWRVEGALPHFSLRRVMTVARLRDGRLLIPHARHRLDAPRYTRRYPELRVFAPPAVLKKASAVVNVDGILADARLDDSASLELLDGTGQAEAALLVRSNDGVSVVLTEIIFDLEPAKSALLRATIKLAGFGPGPVVTPVVKLELVENKAALAAHLIRLAALPTLTRLIVGHSRMSVGPAAVAALRQAAASL